MLEIETRWLAYGVLVIPIASVHLWFTAFAERFKASEARWVGVAGGVALGYVTLYMLPKLSAITVYGVEQYPDAHPFFGLRAYLLLLFGIVLYLVIDRLDQSPALRQRWTAQFLEYGAHGAYHFLAGYLAVEMPRPGLALHALAAAILIAHVMGMTNLLRHRRPAGYPYVRWVLFLLVLAGGTLALVTELPRSFVNYATAFICGIIILNVVAEELPTGYKDKFRWFLLGIGFFVVATFVIMSVPEAAGI